MTPDPERQQYVEWINAAVKSGARKFKACDEVGISLRTLQRWINGDEIKTDARTTVTKSNPSNKLSEVERKMILKTCNSPQYANLPPSQIVPRLADEGVYIASEATFYRVLKESDQLQRRGRARAPRVAKLPTTYTATAPNQVWTWDITYLPTQISGQYYYLYLFEDIYSRKAIGWEVYEHESGELAAGIVERCVMTESCLDNLLVLHSDNGAPMKSSTLLAKLYDLGITPSRGRPRVSNDNPYSESLFRTLKYCPQWPSTGFKNICAARTWVREFISWYNTEHRHSRIRFVTPEQRHNGEDASLLSSRRDLYETAKNARPERWSGKTRNWEPIGEVLLNPDRKTKPMKFAA